VCRDPSTISTIFARLRAFPGGARAAHGGATYPAALAGLRVTRVRDLTRGHGYDSARAEAGYAPELPVSGGHMLTVHAAAPGGAPAVTLTIRTSGTEPKVRGLRRRCGAAGGLRRAADQVLSRGQRAGRGRGEGGARARGRGAGARVDGGGQAWAWDALSEPLFTRSWTACCHQRGQRRFRKISAR
jgi:hypothetical protein